MEAFAASVIAEAEGQRRGGQRLPVLFFRAWDRLRRDSEQDYDAYQDWGNNAHFSSPRAPEENLHAID